MNSQKAQADSSNKLNPITAYLSSIGALGGKAGRGKSKARTSAQARKAALARWAKKKPAK